MLVDERRWMTAEEFNTQLGLCQFLPGPNVVNLAVVVGKRHRGLAGAIVAPVGLLAGPLAIVLVLALLYDRFGGLPLAQGMLRGIAAAGCGLLFAMAWRMGAALRDKPFFLPFTALTVATIAWLRWPRLRWIVILVFLAMLLTGFLFSALFEFAGGEAEWAESGGSRLVLIGRVLEVTMRNPITGLGPGSYRLYAGMEPLSYGPAYWISPQINSHNNYVDLFAHVGVLGLALFSWFAIELARLGLRLRTCFTQGFAAGYVNGALAAGFGALVLMMFADWILPFVYNIGFLGFQASVLVWLFLGGLVTLEQIAHA